jgi:peptide-methionine (S)-S-oxide reductase
MRLPASISLRATTFAALVALLGCAQAAEDAVVIPAPAFDEMPASSSTTAVAVFAGGCFWGVQGVYQHVQGVLKAVSGYAGGSQVNAHYEIVGTGSTGHAETVQITYDPSKVTYGKLLQIFFSVAHDPTQLNMQGPDRGTQYRSTVFPVDAKQREIAEKYIAQLNAAHVYRKTIVTTLEDGRTFYPAEAYHQDYLVRNPDQPYIALYDIPKVRNLAQIFADLYQRDPVLVMARANAKRGNPGGQ